MFSCEGSAIRFILNQFEVLSKRNVERARCNFVMNASGLGVFWMIVRSPDNGMFEVSFVSLALCSYAMSWSL